MFKNLQMLNKELQAETKDDSEQMSIAPTSSPNAAKPNVMRWVSVKDCLPETNCEVLACKSNGLIIQMSYHATFDSGKKIFQWWGFGGWLDQHSQVTHWMPIPPPPIA